MVLPGLAIGHGGEGMLINLWIIVGIHVMGLIILLGFSDWKTIFFYIAITITSFLVCGYLAFVIFGDSYINTMSYIYSYLGLLVFPFVSTYLFYRKIKKNEKTVNDENTKDEKTVATPQRKTTSRRPQSANPTASNDADG
jgi:hypothetical protein